jgi:hypothetical protein
LAQTPSISVLPFFYSIADLLFLDSSNREVTNAVEAKAWVTAPDHPWDWPEYAWAKRLLHCLEDAPALHRLKVVTAFRWKPKTYE